MEVWNSNTETLNAPGSSWRPLLIFLGVVAVALVVFALLLPALASRRRPDPHQHCRQSLKAIGYALTNYSLEMKCFPPSVTRDSRGIANHGWRAAILPFIELRYSSAYNPRLPWYFEGNRKTMEPYAELFHSLADESLAQQASYVAVTRPGFLFDAGRVVKPADVTDGLENTIMLVEASSTGILFDAPGDLTWEDFAARYEDKSLSTHGYGHGFHVLFADGQVVDLGYSNDIRVLRAMFTIGGGEDLKAMGYRAW